MLSTTAFPKTYIYASNQSNRSACRQFLFKKGENVQDVSIWVSTYMGGVYVEKLNLTTNRYGQRTIVALIKSNGKEGNLIIKISPKKLEKLKTAERKIYDISHIISTCSMESTMDLSKKDVMEIGQRIGQYVASLAI